MRHKHLPRSFSGHLGQVQVRRVRVSRESETRDHETCVRETCVHESRVSVMWCAGGALCVPDPRPDIPGDQEQYRTSMNNLGIYKKRYIVHIICECLYNMSSSRWQRLQYAV